MDGSSSLAKRRKLCRDVRQALYDSAFSGLNEGLYNAHLVSLRNPRKHWKRKDPLRRVFGNRQIPRAVSESRIRLLKVQGNRVVDSRTDVFLAQGGLHHLAVFYLDHVQVIDTLRPGWFIWRYGACLQFRKQLVVLAGTLASAVVPPRQVFQLDIQNPSLN